MEIETSEITGESAIERRKQHTADLNVQVFETVGNTHEAVEHGRKVLKTLNGMKDVVVESDIEALDGLDQEARNMIDTAQTTFTPSTSQKPTHHVTEVNGSSLNQSLMGIQRITHTR